MIDGATLLIDVLTTPLPGHQPPPQQQLPGNNNQPPLQQQAPQKTPNELQRDALLSRWDNILQAIGAAQQKLALGGRSPGSEELKLRDEQAKVYVFLNVPAFKDAPSDNTFGPAYNAALQAVNAFENTSWAKFPAQEVRNREATTLVSQATQVSTALDAEAAQGAQAEVATALQDITLLLKAPVSAQALLTGAGSLQSLKEKIDAIGKQCEEDRAKRKQARQTLIERIGGAPADAKATTQEKDHLATLAKPITDLPEIPSTKQLEDATKAAEAVEQEATVLKQRVEERTKRFENAAKLLERLAPKAPALTPHARASANDTKPVLEEAANLLAQSGKFTAWEQVATWDANALVELEKAIAGLETRMTEVKKLTEGRIVKAEEAFARVTEAIEKASDRPFSGTQQSFLKGLIKPQTDLFGQDTANAETVVQALNKQADAATALSKALAGLAKRLAAVTPPLEASLSPKEIDALKKAREAATKALDEVTEL